MYGNTEKLIFEILPHSIFYYNQYYRYLVVHLGRFGGIDITIWAALQNTVYRHPSHNAFFGLPKNRVRRNSHYVKPNFAFSNPSPSEVFDRVSRGITNSNLQAKKFALSETALWETTLAEGCL